jgi:hypothetical protein
MGARTIVLMGLRVVGVICGLTVVGMGVWGGQSLDHDEVNANML